MMWPLFSHRRAFAAAIFVLCGLAYTQAPLYYSNQNQYFLHGLAQAGRGNLDNDWLANTADPTPVFSGLVAFTGRFLHESLFHVYHLLIIALYFYALTGLVVWHDPASGGREPPDGSTKSGGSRLPLAEKQILLFLALFVFLHAGIVRWASVEIFSVDYPWYFQAGLAGQYVLGGMLQPSVFGVLLLASLLAFVRQRPWLAAVLAALGGIIHATYLLPAAFLTLAYMVVLWRDKGWRHALCFSLTTLALVTPALGYHLVHFAPTSAESFAEAQSILAHFRIPHHAEPERWFDFIAFLQVIWCLMAMALVWRTRLFLLLLIPFSLGLVLTFIQIWTRSDTLALFFPWRISAILVPVSSAIIVGRAAARLAQWTSPQGRWLRLGSITLLAGLAAGGLAVQILELGYQTGHEENALLVFVKKNLQPNDQYLLPVDTPNLKAAKRGAASTNFTPPPRRGHAKGLIAIDLQRFRLHAGAAVFVDFKAIPYKDVEVLEWRRRLQVAQEWYAGDNLAETLDRDELIRHKITHVVVPEAKQVECNWLRPLFDYRYYKVYLVE